MFALENNSIGEKIIIEGNYARVARSPHRVKIPGEYSADLAYLAGYHLGDGYLDNPLRRGRKQSHEVVYCDQYKEQMQLVSSIFSKEFELPLVLVKKRDDAWVGRRNSKVIHIFLNKILMLPVGRKGTFTIPPWVF